MPESASPTSGSMTTSMQHLLRSRGRGSDHPFWADGGPAPVVIKGSERGDRLDCRIAPRARIREGGGCRAAGTPLGARPLEAAENGARGYCGPAGPRRTSISLKRRRAGAERMPTAPRPAEESRAARRVSTSARCGSVASASSARSSEPSAATRQNAAARSSASARSPSKTPRRISSASASSSSGPAGFGAPATTGSMPASRSDPAAVGDADLLGVAADHLAQQVEAPERAGQAQRRRTGPQLGDRVDPLPLGERDEPRRRPRGPGSPARD